MRLQGCEDGFIKSFRCSTAQYGNKYSTPYLHGSVFQLLRLLALILDEPSLDAMSLMQAPSSLPCRLCQGFDSSGSRDCREERPPKHPKSRRRHDFGLHVGSHGQAGPSQVCRSREYQLCSTEPQCPFPMSCSVARAKVYVPLHSLRHGFSTYKALCRVTGQLFDS